MIKNGKSIGKYDQHMLMNRLASCVWRLHLKVTNKGKMSSLSFHTHSEAIMKASIERKLSQHMSALSVHKASLERQIVEEMKKRLPCTLSLQRLKRLKLDTKDRMAELRRRLNRMPAPASP